MNRARLTHLGEGDGQTHGRESPLNTALGTREACVEGSHGELRSQDKWEMERGRGSSTRLVLVQLGNRGWWLCAVEGQRCGEAKVNECQQAAWEREANETNGGVGVLGEVLEAVCVFDGSAQG